METRAFETSRWFAMVLIVALSVIAFFGVQRALAGPEDAPLAARKTVAWNTAGITADTNTSASLTQAYCYHDLFCDIDHHAAGGVTITVYSSPAGTNYYTTCQLVQSVTNQHVFTRVLSYGRYERLSFDVNDTNLITPTCTSIYFNDWYPCNYADDKVEN